MGRKTKKEPEIKNPEFLHKLTDDQIYEYIFTEIRKNLPNPNLPLILITEEMEKKPQKVGAYYATVGKIERVGEFVHQNTHISYEEYINGRWLQGGGFILNLKISDYDCVNTAPNRYEPHPNETWVDYVDSIVDDKTYMEKAKKYMHDTYADYFERNKESKIRYWDGSSRSDDEKPSMRI